eukprot:14534331-Ditylum_brightwellii.AAC.1
MGTGVEFVHSSGGSRIKNSHRNAVVQGSCPCLVGNIKYAYHRLQHQMSNHDAQLFLTSLADQLTMTNGAKFHWLRDINLSMKAYTKFDKRPPSLMIIT